jgi:hypothetical protein
MGGCVGSISLIAEPQGEFVYAINSELTALAVNQQTGALTNVGSRSGAGMPSHGGIGIPFTFAASGISPVWQRNCTHGCAMAGYISRGGGGGGGGSPLTNPAPPTSHYLSVTQDPYFGFVSSSPAGIEYGPATHANPLGYNVSANHFPANSTVQLCATAPPQPVGAYDVAWTGSCSGTGLCTTVRMTSDKACKLAFTLVSARYP